MENQFKKVLGVWDATAIVVGVIIGSGIFLTTGIIAQYISSPLWILGCWLAGGIITITGAFTFAQLACYCSKSGGSYTYLREAFGDMIGFVYGWMLFLVIQCGSIAAVAVGFSIYLGKSLPIISSWEQSHFPMSIANHAISLGQLIAIAAIILLTFLNYFGANLGSKVQNFLTLIKIVTLSLFITAIFYQNQGQQSLTVNTATPSLTQFALGLIPILWTFSGWYNINFSAEEVQEPQRNIPLSLLYGIIIVTVLYMLINLAYFLTIPAEQLPGMEQIAFVAGQQVFGEKTAIFISAMIAIFALGSLNGLIFASPYAYFAMARDKIFLGLSPQLHHRFKTPHKFIMAQGIWSSFLVFWGGYESLLNYVMFSGLLFTALTGVALFVYRQRNPEIKMVWQWSYPTFPIIFILSSLGLAGVSLWNHPITSGISLTIVVICCSVFWGIQKIRRTVE